MPLLFNLAAKSLAKFKAPSLLAFKPKALPLLEHNVVALTSSIA